MPQIVIDNVSKSYGAVQALDDVSIAIESGTTTAVVGPSGGGKSTLLQLINGLVRPDGGRVLVFEQPIDYSQLPRLRLQIGYAVQGTGLFPHMDACTPLPARTQRRSKTTRWLVPGNDARAGGFSVGRTFWRPGSHYSQ
jgi:ABC-type multidrug transport system ATPase subunit